MCAFLASSENTFIEQFELCHTSKSQRIDIFHLENTANQFPKGKVLQHKGTSEFEPINCGLFLLLNFV